MVISHRNTQRTTDQLSAKKPLGSSVNLTVKSIDRLALNDPAWISSQDQIVQYRNREGLECSHTRSEQQDNDNNRRFYVLTQGAYALTFNENIIVSPGSYGVVSLNTLLVEQGCIGQGSPLVSPTSLKSSSFIVHVFGGGKLYIEQDSSVATLTFVQLQQTKTFWQRLFS